MGYDNKIRNSPPFPTVDRLAGDFRHMSQAPGPLKEDGIVDKESPEPFAVRFVASSRVTTGFRTA